MLDRIGEPSAGRFEGFPEEDDPVCVPQTKQEAGATPPASTGAPGVAHPHPLAAWIRADGLVRRAPSTRSGLSLPSVPRQARHGAAPREAAAALERQKAYLGECVKDCPDPRLRLALEHSLRALGMDRDCAGRALGWSNSDREMDCSGFVNTVYRNAGLPLEQQLDAANGTGTERMAAVLPRLPVGASPRTGDLILFNTDDPGAEGVNHVGILIVDKFGNVGVLQNTNSGVRFTSLEDASRNGGPSWRDTFRCLRRPSFD